MKTVSITLRIDRDLKNDLQNMADRETRSLSQQVIHLVKIGLGTSSKTAAENQGVQYDTHEDPA